MVPVKRHELSFSKLLGFQHWSRILHEDFPSCTHFCLQDQTVKYVVVAHVIPSSFMFAMLYHTIVHYVVFLFLYLPSGN